MAMQVSAGKGEEGREGKGGGMRLQCLFVCNLMLTACSWSGYSGMHHVRAPHPPTPFGCMSESLSPPPSHPALRCMARLTTS